MTITSIIVLYAVAWFMSLFVILPLRLTTQHEAGEIIPGTPPSAPSDLRLGRKMRLTTIVATLIWAAICAVILSGVLTVEDIDVFHRLTAEDIAFFNRM
ncbi:MAG: DUF1467 family protein [Alphaproteobacteria bacterium]|nr:MAG: DUF1467 family protein [Alphaproteobacteria bacterium]